MREYDTDRLCRPVESFGYLEDDSRMSRSQPLDSPERLASLDVARSIKIPCIDESSN